MFDVLLESNRARASAGGSLALSAVVHGVMIAAVVGITSRAPSLEPVPESFITRALYMPPVDRRPAEAGTAERLQFVALGVPAGVLDEFTDMPIGVSEFGGAVRDPDAGSEFGDAELQSVALPPVASVDSAYSVVDVDSIVQRHADSDAPLYPPVLLMQSVEGTVFVRYTVDTLGRADVRTAEVIRSSHPHFTQAVLEALPGMRFRPAMIATRRVRQLVEQEFAFKIQRPDVAETPPSAAAP